MHEPTVKALVSGSPTADSLIGQSERAAAVETPQPLGRDWARWRPAINACVATRVALLALFLGTGWFFASSLGFGFIWDDPSWFGRVVGKSLAEIVAPSPDFHFYRPGTMLYIRLFLRADGTFAAAALHWLQACWHLLNLALAFAIGRRIGLGRGAAVALVMLVALYPFSYQAVAWAAPQQPLAMTLQQGAWLAYLFVRRRRQSAEKRWPALLASLFLFILALTVQEVTLPMALMPLLFEIALSWHRRRAAGGSQRIPLSLASGWHLAIIYPLIAAIYGVLWLQAPRQPGITGWHFDGQVGRYLLQGIVYPVFARPAGYPPNHVPADGLFLAGALATLGLCVGLALWRGRAPWAFLGLGWALLGVAPTAVGLPYDYVSLAPRLLYYAAPGVALVWVIAWWPSRPVGGVFRWRHATGALLLALVVVQSSLLLANFEDLYQRGADHLNELLGQIGDDRRYLFVNFPDRYAPKRPPFPFGYWGVTLAPVSVDLADYLAAITGARPQTTSVSLPWIDGEARTGGPDQIDLRGVITPPDELYEMAAGYDAVYISHSRPDGRYVLRPAGALLVETRAGCRLALYGDAVCLHDVEVVEESDVIRFRLVWSAWSALDPHWTIFAHLGEPDRPPVAQADGDSWEGALPLALWRPGDLIVDERTIARPARGEGPFLIIGVYDWVTGERLPVTYPDGHKLPGYGYVLALRANS